MAFAGEAADFQSRFITRAKLSERWNVRPATLRLLERRKLIPEAITLPGRRDKVYRMAEIARIEAEYAGPAVVGQPSQNDVQA